MTGSLSFALIGFLVMIVFPLAFWWALSVAIIKRSRAYVAVTAGIGLSGAALTVFAVWSVVNLGWVG